MKLNMWDNASGEYHKAVGDSGDLFHKIYTNPLIFKLLGNVKNKKILDLACGQGYFSELMEDKGAMVFGIDYSKELIKLAKKRNLKTKFFVGSSSNMSVFKKEFFDIIVCNFGLQDIKDLSSTMKECARVLKKNGKFIWVIPHPAFYLAKKGEENGKYFKKVFEYKKLKVTSSNIGASLVKQYHRPIDYYLKEMFKNGFLVNSFYEVATRHSNGKLVKDNNLLKYRTGIPSFLVVGGIKV